MPAVILPKIQPLSLASDIASPPCRPAKQALGRCSAVAELLAQRLAALRAFEAVALALPRGVHQAWHQAQIDAE